MNSRGNVAVAAVIILLLLSAGGYWYWQSQYQNTNDTTDDRANTIKPLTSATIQPTLQENNIDEWRESSYKNRKSWYFQYPPYWVESYNESNGTYGYRPAEITEGSFGFGVSEITRPVNSAVDLIDQPAGSRVEDNLILSQDTISVDGHKADMITYMLPGYNELAEYPGKTVANSNLSLLVAIGNVKFFDDKNRCIDGALMVSAGHYNPDGVENLDFEYRDLILEILSTFEINDCGSF